MMMTASTLTRDETYELLGEWADFMATVPEEEFSMNTWMKQWACHTTRCAGGWAATMEKLRVRGLRLKKLIGGYQIRLGQAGGSDAIALAFSISEDEAEWITEPLRYNKSLVTIPMLHVIGRINEVRVKYAPAAAPESATVSVDIQLHPAPEAAPAAVVPTENEEVCCVD